MNPLDLWHACQHLRVHLTIQDGHLAYGGRKADVIAVLADLKAHKDDMLDCVAALHGLPVADGPFLPYCVPLSPERAAAMLTELRQLIDALATAEKWPEEQKTHLLAKVRRQPVYTLADDLAYFRQRLSNAVLDKGPTSDAQF